MKRDLEQATRESTQQREEFYDRIHLCREDFYAVRKELERLTMESDERRAEFYN